MDPVHADPLVVLGRKLPLVDEPRQELDGPEFMLIIESLKRVPRDDQLQRVRPALRWRLRSSCS